MNNISTDEITPGWVCFYYDETLGQYVYVGMREGAVQKDEVKQGGFAVVVSGLSKGCGSSRETAPYAEKWAGHSAGDRPEHRKDLRPKLTEYRVADFDWTLAHSSAFSSGEEIPLDRIHERSRSDLAVTSSNTAGCSTITRRVWSGKVSPPSVESQSLVEQLVDVGQISADEAKTNMFLNVIQRVGSNTTAAADEHRSKRSLPGTRSLAAGQDWRRPQSNQATRCLPSPTYASRMST